MSPQLTPQAAHARPNGLPAPTADSCEFAAYLAPGVAPLSEEEIRLICQQTAGLLGCEGDELRPVFNELHHLGEIEAEFSWLPQEEQARGPYLALLALLRNGAHRVGNCCCMLVHDLQSPFPALDYLKGLEEIVRLPVLLCVCRQPRPGAAQRQIVVHRLR